MGISKDNYVIKGLSGTVGQLLTFRQRKGKTVVQKFRRTPTIPPTEKLQSVRMNFASCIAYAKKAIKNPELKAAYQEAAIGGQTAFNMATSDALNRPQLTNVNTVHYHGIAGDVVSIQAKDDFKVMEVVVSIQLPTGELLEQGNALYNPKDDVWIYTAIKNNPIPAGSRVTATAMDLPRNSDSLSITIY